MNKFFLTCISVLLSTLMFSQDFEYTHKSSENHTLSDVLELDSTYLLVVGIEPFQPLYVWIDKKGNFIKDSLDTNGVGWQEKEVIERKSGGFVLVEQVDIREPILKVKLCDENLSVQKTYNVNLEQLSDLIFVVHSRLISDSLLMLANSVGGQFETDAFVYVLNIHNGKDTLIDLSTTEGIFDIATDVFYLGGKYYVVKTMRQFDEEPDCRPYTGLVRLNQDFSTDTIVPICNSISSENGADLHTANALVIDDSTFMLSGVVETDNISHFSETREDLGFVKIDTNFTELNAQAFGKMDTNALGTLQGISRYENDSFVYVGGTESITIVPGMLYESTSYFSLSKSDLEGNLIWTRYYTNDSYLRLFKVLATSDGGALLAGTSYDYKNSSERKNDIWVVKVDKNGNMDTTTSIVENGKIPENHFVFFPNPAREYITFRQLNVQRDYQLQLYDLQGRLMYETEVNQSQIQIDISTYAQGAYFYRLSDSKGNQASGKLIKE